MNTFDFFIRFGVHKDREVIKSLRDSISGIIIPAHILCYSTNATIAAISYIRRGFFIDPMTFVYASPDIRDYVVQDKTTHRDKFKPSIAKLTDHYGLTTIFENNQYRPLRPQDLQAENVVEG